MATEVKRIEDRSFEQLIVDASIAYREWMQSTDGDSREFYQDYWRALRNEARRRDTLEKGE